MAHRSALFSRCFRTSFLCLLHVVLAAQATLPATSIDDGVLTEFVAKVRFAKCASHLSSLATAARKHGENASTTKMAALYDMRSPGTRLSLTACDLGVLPRHGPTGLNNSHGCQHTLCEHDRAFNGIRVHPLPTGIGNQMQYSNAFLAVAAMTSSWVGSYTLLIFHSTVSVKDVPNIIAPCLTIPPADGKIFLNTFLRVSFSLNCPTETPVISFIVWASTRCITYKR